MNTTAKTFGILITVGSLMSAVTPVTAASIPARYDFGTDPGKVTPAAAGFTITTDAIVTATNEANAIRFTTGDSHANGVFLKPFEDIGGVNTNNFTLTTDVKLQATTGGNFRRFGLVLFSEGGNTGISAQVHRDGNNNWTIRFRNGLDGPIIGNSSVPFNTSSNYAPGDTFAFAVSAAYLTGNELRLAFTLTDSRGNAATTTATIDRTAYTGQQFGGSTRARDYAVDFENFVITP